MELSILIHLKEGLFFFFVNLFSLLFLGDALLTYLIDKFAPQKYKDYIVYRQYTFYKTKVNPLSYAKYSLCAGIFMYSLFVAILLVINALKRI